MYINADQSTRLQDIIKTIEKRTGIELITAMVGKCDSYPEIPWKAFALAASVSAMVHLAAALLYPGLSAVWGVRQAPLFTLGIGAVFALLAVFWPAFGRLFLDHIRAETEIEQYARVSFLERELFRTGNRTGILVLVGLFERRVVIVPDSGFAGRLDEKALQGIIQKMVPHLRRKERFQAFIQGLTALETELLRAGFGPGQKTGNEIADTIIQEKGEGR